MCVFLPATAGRVMCDSSEAVKAVCVFGSARLAPNTLSKLSKLDQLTAQLGPAQPNQ